MAKLYHTCAPGWTTTSRIRYSCNRFIYCTSKYQFQYFKCDTFCESAGDRPSTSKETKEDSKEMWHTRM